MSDFEKVFAKILKRKEAGKPEKRGRKPVRIQLGDTESGRAQMKAGAPIDAEDDAIRGGGWARVEYPRNPSLARSREQAPWAWHTSPKSRRDLEVSL